jgi:hypothetical protein
MARPLYLPSPAGALADPHTLVVEKPTLSSPTEHESRAQGSAQEGQPAEPFVLKRIGRGEAVVRRGESR